MQLAEVRQAGPHRSEPTGRHDSWAAGRGRPAGLGTVAGQVGWLGTDSVRTRVDSQGATAEILMKQLGAAGRDLTLRVFPLGRLWRAVRLLQQQCWLTQAERFQAARLLDLRRREEWLCGRLALKWLALERLGIDEAAPLSGVPNDATETAELAHWLAAVEVQSWDERGRAVRPQLSFRGWRLPWSVSLSHSRKTVAVCVAHAASWRVGVDVVHLHELTGSSEEGTLRFTAASSLELWLQQSDAVPPVRLSPLLRGQTWSFAPGPLHRSLTPAGRPTREQAARAEAVAIVWAVKEAAYKAANSGQSFRPSAVAVAPTSDGSRLWRWQWAGVGGVAAVERTGGDGAAAEVVALALTSAAPPAMTG